MEENFSNNHDYFFPKTISDIKGFAIFMMNPEGIINYWNRGCEVMIGYTPEEIIGRHYEMLFPDFLLEKDMPKLELEETFRTGKYEHENWRLKKNGELFWAYVVLTKVVDENGKFIGYVKITQDHSERKRLEDDLISKNETLMNINLELEQANAVINNDLDGFVYTASHELRAPISNMEGILNALIPHQCFKDDSSKQLFGMMVESVDRLKLTIKELTEISKTQKLIEEDVHDVAIKEIFEEVKLSLTDLIKQYYAEIDTEIDNTTVINFSQRNLKRLLFNLLNNALKYHSPERIPKIFVRGEIVDGYYVLMIKDNGLGIKKEHLEKIFLMFKRFHNHLEGAGIGLYMVKKIIEKSGGKIELVSEVDRGSTFKIYFKI